MTAAHETDHALQTLVSVDRIPDNVARAGCPACPARRIGEITFMQRLRQIVTGIALTAMVLGSGLVASAQSTPAPDTSDPRFQLAAVTPGPEDLPTGYVFVGETFLNTQQVAAAGFDAGALDSAGFLGQYVSVYENPDADQRIRAYASLWSDDAAAGNGFQILEDEAVSNPDDALEDSGTDVGEEPRETTTGTYAADDGTTIGSVDVTFRRGTMVIGVAHETLDGSAADPTIAADLASRMDQRAQAVVAGDPLPHIDMTLPGKTVSLESGTNGLVQAGFLGPVEVESIYAVQGSLLSGIDSSWVETNIIGATSTDAPLVTIGVASFTNDGDAVLAAEQSADLFTPLPGQEAVDGVTIEGADAVSAFRYASSDASGMDSYRLVIAAGGVMTVIDVQQAASDAGAEETAMAIATAQVTCLGGGACDAPALPGSLTGQ